MVGNARGLEEIEQESKVGLHYGLRRDSSVNVPIQMSYGRLRYCFSGGGPGQREGYVQINDLRERLSSCTNTPRGR